ncbi:BAR and SH3 domains-containing protein [Sporobolomyces koalae]|uniref:BAR and SH3 domains-containing protein n=1 Tax=Sporobolomyces koalae TaxID=500713 RepID=UPI00316CDC89
MNRLKQSLNALPSFSGASNERATRDPISEDRLASITARRALVNNHQLAFASYYKTVAKERTNPTITDTTLSGLAGRGETQLPARWFGQTLIESSQSIEVVETEAEERYRDSLALVGEAHLEYSNLAQACNTTLRQGFLDTLERRLEQFKEFDKLMKDAEKKRSSLEALMAKIEKSKKEKSEYEFDLDQAEWAYGDACESLDRKAEQIENGTGDDVEALKELIDAQLEFATNYASILQSVRNQLPSPVKQQVRSSSRSESPSNAVRSGSPATRSRSSTLQVSAASTRMNRSLSDSSAQNVPSAFSSSILSSLGPGRTRRSTVSSQSDDKDKEKDSKNGSRSGSVLERFALGASKKDKKKKDKNGENVGGTDSTDPTEKEHDHREDAATRSRSNSATTGSPSRFGSSGWGSPSLPTMGSLKKLASPSSQKYGALRDDDSGSNHSGGSADRPTIASLDFGSATSSSGHQRRMTPPPLKRTQTAPPLTIPGRSSSPASPRVLSPLRPVALPRMLSSPIGRTYLAKWAYHPSLADPDELEFDKGDLIVVSKEVNTDWWIGQVVRGRHERGETKGMFPSAYVVLHEAEDSEELGQRNGQTLSASRTSVDSDRDHLHRSETTDEDETSVDEEEFDHGQHPRTGSGPAQPFSYTAANVTRSPPPVPQRSAPGTRKQPPPPPKRTASGNILSTKTSDEVNPFD